MRRNWFVSVGQSWDISSEGGKKFSFFFHFFFVRVSKNTLIFSWLFVKWTCSAQVYYGRSTFCFQHLKRRINPLALHF